MVEVEVGRMGRRALGVVALALAAALVALALLGAEADRSRAHDLSSGSAWFASTPTGRAVLLDGATGKATVRVPVSDGQDAFDVVPFGVDAVVIASMTACGSSARAFVSAS